jgi:hypothetical protein
LAKKVLLLDLNIMPAITSEQFTLPSLNFFEEKNIFSNLFQQ